MLFPAHPPSANGLLRPLAAIHPGGEEGEGRGRRGVEREGEGGGWRGKEEERRRRMVGNSVLAVMFLLVYLQ